MVGGSPQLKLLSQKYSGGTADADLRRRRRRHDDAGLVNRPTGDPPLQTFALPVALKTPAAPVTHQLNKHSDQQNVLVKAGDTIQVSLMDQPSTDFQWKFQKPNAKVLKQVGEPKFFPNNDTMGSKGKMVWTFSVVGAGKTPLIADYQSVPADAMPVKTWQVNVAAKPGFTPKTVAAAPSDPADSVHVLPGDTIKLKLAASAGTWGKPASTKQLTASKPVKQGKTVVIDLKAEATTAWRPRCCSPRAAAVIPRRPTRSRPPSARARLPVTVHANERHVAKPIEVKAGDLFDIAIESNTASTGYQWTVEQRHPRRCGRAAGRPDHRGADDRHAGRPGRDRVPLQGTCGRYRAAGAARAAAG